MSLLRAAAHLLFPPACQLCRRPGEFPICQDCLRTLPRIRPPFCPRCGYPLTSPPGSSGACPGCPRDRACRFLIRSWGIYDGPLREAVHALKFGGRRALARPLGALMAGVAAADPLLRDVCRIVPVPLHPSRLRERGFNQAQALAEEVGRRLGTAVDARVLQRVRPTLPQAELRAVDRRANVRGAFRMRGRAAWPRVLLVDDVMSTGSTVAECARTLRQGGAGEVVVLTLARALREVSAVRNPAAVV